MSSSASRLLPIPLADEERQATAAGQGIVEVPGELSELVLAAHERTARRLCRRLGPRRDLQVQCRVLGEDRALEPAQSLARLDAQLVDQRPARVLVGLERVGLPVRAVQGEHQLCPQPLPVRMLGDQRLQLADELAVAAEREPGLDALLERREPQVVEPRDLRLRERLVGEVGERRAAPECHRLVEHRERPLGVARRQGTPALADQPLEPVRVERSRLQPELVAVRARDDRAV
jgi:hypothetical protein